MASTTDGAPHAAEDEQNESDDDQDDADCLYDGNGCEISDNEQDYAEDYHGVSWLIVNPIMVGN